MNKAAIPIIKDISYVTNRTTYLEDMTLRQKTEKIIYEVRVLHRGKYDFQEISRKYKETKIEHKSFKLKEVSPEELYELRNSTIPSFVLKKNGHLYWTQIPKNMSLMGATQIIGEHQCAIPMRDCRRLSARSDENGGCEKVRDRAQCIERYPWITDGFETFNTSEKDVFLVANCEHYKL